MRINELPLPALLALTVACSAGNHEPASSGDATPGTPAVPAQYVEGKDYTVLERVRFMDSAGFQQPAEAFSVLLPRGWSHDGGIQWKNLQQCRGEMVGAQWTVASPDGTIRFKALPVHAWGTASDPMMLQALHQQAQQGGCEVGDAMSAEQYVRDVFAPRELDGATITEVRANEAATAELRRQADADMPKLQPYLPAGASVRVGMDAVTARLTWPDGTEGIALVSVTSLETTMQNPYTGQMQRLVNGGAPERSYIRFPAAQRQQAEILLANLKSSYRTNPQWKEAIDGYFERMRRQQDAIHHQKMEAIAIQTAANARAHAQRMADIQRQGAASTQRFQQRMADMDSSMRAWETQQASRDRSHTAFVQSIREVETWQGNDGKVELSSGYSQAWSRGDGSYILSNSPSFDPRSVLLDQNWQELKRSDP